MIRKIAATFLSAWGWVCLFGVFYYTSLYIRHPNDPYRAEYWEGVGFAWAFGLVTWLALPLVTAFSWRNFGRVRSLILNIPVAIAIIYFCAYWGSAIISN